MNEAVKKYCEDYEKNNPQDYVEISKQVVFFDAAHVLMDEEICNQVSYELAPCEKQAFADRYCELHAEKYGAKFEVN